MGKKLFLILLSALLVLTGCSDTVEELSQGGESKQEASSDETSQGGEEMEITNHLALGAIYAYGYSSKAEGDDALTALTDGKTDTFVTLSTDIKNDGKNELDLTFTDWYSKSHTVQMKKNYVLLTVDLGFVANVKEIQVVTKDKDCLGTEVFTSDDGYNFTNYAGAFDTVTNGVPTFEIQTGLAAKAILLVIPADAEETVSISEIIVKGESSAKKEALAAEATVVSKKDAITGKDGKVVQVDLGSVQNVSEVLFTASRDKVERLNVRYSVDGETWSDLGQSYLHSSGADLYRYLVTRNHTVEARYLEVYTYVSTSVSAKDVTVYGCKEAVAEPNYEFIQRKNQLSNTNVSAYNKASLNGKEEAKLTDMSFVNFVKGNAGANTVEVTMGQSYSDLCALALNTYRENPYDMTVTADGKEVSFSLYETEVAGSFVSYLFFDQAVAGQKLTVTFHSGEAAQLSEIMVYCGQPQLPLVRGGFFQLPTAGGGNPSSQNSEYAWYLQLKGMRDLGMEYVVLQYSAHYNARSTLINGKNIKAKGFRYTATYGCTDVPKAVLDAAEKLGMKVYLGTMHDADFTNPIANMESYEGMVDAAFAIIKDINNLYGAHPAFAGYYLSDETCDAWLNLKGGVDAARYVYKNQSDLIREIAPEAKIMIAPAIWRSGKPEQGADNLYRMLAPEKEGDKPIVDIVAAQDCLGREQTLYVTNEAYASFESYVEEWAKAVRRAGAEFWHDAEVFEIIGSSKRCEEVIKSLNIELKTSGTVIVFDIPHYFTTYSMGAYNDVKNCYKVAIMRDYVKYYSTMKELDTMGTEADQPAVNTHDGKEVDTSGRLPVIKPVVTTKKYNEGVLQFGTPDPAAVTAWQTFKLGNNSGAKPEYALYWDADNFYVLLKTGDTTASYGKGAWWAGNDDLVQIWMTADGSTTSGVLTLDTGIRYYLHRTGENKWTPGGEAGSLATFSGFTFEEKDGVLVIKMPWTSLNVEAPDAGSGAVIGIKIQYIDGADSSWAASDGTKDQSVQVSALYSF